MNRDSGPARFLAGETGVPSPTRGLFDVFGGHLIALRHAALTPTGEKMYFYSGTLAFHSGHVFWLTAGHVISSIDRQLKDESLRDHQFALGDFFGHTVRSSVEIPFSYPNSVRYALEDDDKGVDFGFVQIDPISVRSLITNMPRVTNLEEPSAPALQSETRVFVVGLPEAGFMPSVEEVRGAQPALVWLDIDVAGPREGKITQTFGRMHETFEQSLKGMSGGPIVAMQRDPAPLVTVVGIQTSWSPRSKHVFGHSIWDYKALIEACLSPP